MTSIIMSAAAAVLLVILFVKIVSAPIKKIFKLLLNALSGFLILILANFISGFFDFSIPINFINILVTGIMGIPGAILLVLLHFIA